MDESKECMIYQTYFKDCPDIMDVEQLGNILGVGKRTVYRLLKDKKIKFYKIGRTYHILKKDVLTYLNIMTKNEIEE